MNLQACAFNLPAAATADPLRRILKSACSSQCQSTDSTQVLYWDATFFGLEGVRIYREASPQEQQSILAIANQDLLEEIYWVEHGGVGYMAKMALLAETTEERLLYGLFAADEASHLIQITAFLGNPPVFKGDAFLQLMGDLIESSDKALLMTVVQVVLEGWGLSHYRTLAQSCLTLELREVLQGFLAAESRHHAAGVVGLQDWQYSPDSLDNIHAALSRFLQMVQVGPQRLLTAIAQGKGFLSKTDKITILEELHTEKQSQTRLNLLKSLLKNNIPPQLLQRLEDQGSFSPFPAQNCVL